MFLVHAQHRSTINTEVLLHTGFNIIYYCNDQKYTVQIISSQLSGCSINFSLIYCFVDPIFNLIFQVGFKHIFIIIFNPRPRNYIALILSISQTSLSVITHKILFFLSPTDLLQHFQHLTIQTLPYLPAAFFISTYL